MKHSLVEILERVLIKLRPQSAGHIEFSYEGPSEVFVLIRPCRFQREWMKYDVRLTRTKMALRKCFFFLKKVYSPL